MQQGNAIKKDIPFEFMTPNNRSLSYIEKEMSIYVYTSTATGNQNNATGTKRWQEKQN